MTNRNDAPVLEKPQTGLWPFQDWGPPLFTPFRETTKSGQIFHILPIQCNFLAFKCSQTTNSYSWINQLFPFNYNKVIWGQIVKIENNILISPGTQYARFLKYRQVNIYFYSSILIFKMSALIYNQQKWCPGIRKTSNWPLT